LARHSGDRAEAERKTYRRRGPTPGRKINGDEWAEPGLDVANEEVEPVEPVLGRQDRRAPIASHRHPAHPRRPIIYPQRVKAEPPGVVRPPRPTRRPVGIPARPDFRPGRD